MSNKLDKRFKYFALELRDENLFLTSSSFGFVDDINSFINSQRYDFFMIAEYARNGRVYTPKTSVNTNMRKLKESSEVYANVK